MNLVEIIKTNKSQQIQYHDNIYCINLLNHNIENFNSSPYKIINGLMIMTYFIYNQPVGRHTKEKRTCWLCNNSGIFQKILEYKNVFDKPIHLHEYCFDNNFKNRKLCKYQDLVVDNQDYHVLILNNQYIVYNEKYIHYICYNEFKFVPYPKMITCKDSFKIVYKDWSLKYLIDMHLSKLLYLKRKLNHHDIMSYILPIFVQILIND